MTISSLIPDVFLESAASGPVNAVPTTLYSLVPLGTGTANAESLASYLARLALLHHVNPSVLLAEILSLDRDLQGDASWILKCRMPYAQAHFAGQLTLGSLALRLGQIVAVATGVPEVQFGTMSQLLNVLGASRLRRRDRFVCLSCLEEDGKKCIYERLLWEFTHVTVCPKHHISLVATRCGSSTARRLDRWWRPYASGVCRVCGSVGYRCIKAPERSQASQDSIWVSIQIGEIICKLPEAKVRFSRERLADSLDQLIDTEANGNLASAARKWQMDKSSLWGWVHGSYNPSMIQLLRLAYLLELSVAELLAGNIVFKKRPNVAPAIFQSKPKRKATHKLAVIQKSLRRYLKQRPCPSLQSISLELDVDNKTLRYHFPALSRMIVKTSRRHSIQIAVCNRRKARAKFNGAIAKLRKRGLPITRRRLERVLGSSLRGHRSYESLYNDWHARQV